CSVVTPWGGGSFLIPVVVAFNLQLESNDNTDVTLLLDPFFDTTGSPTFTWAIWSPAVQSTPAPGTIAILGAGLLAFVLNRGRRMSYAHVFIQSDWSDFGSDFVVQLYWQN